MAQLRGYKRWTLNMGLLVLATLLFMSALLSALETHSVVTWAFAIIFGGFTIMYFILFFKDIDKDKGTYPKEKR